VADGERLGGGLTSRAASEPRPNELIDADERLPIGESLTGEEAGEDRTDTVAAQVASEPFGQRLDPGLELCPALLESLVDGVVAEDRQRGARGQDGDRLRRGRRSSPIVAPGRLPGHAPVATCRRRALAEHHDVGGDAVDLGKRRRGQTEAGQGLVENDAGTRGGRSRRGPAR
jgi:hypothetical protein